jgi:hypothetical protein
MGRSYIYECPKCGYKARVSGRVDEGLHLLVQTILCKDCRELHDAVTRLRVPDDPARLRNTWRRLQPSGNGATSANSKTPPRFDAAVNRLRYPGLRNLSWIEFRLACPVSPYHRVRIWNEPDKCPRCGVFLERGALPFRQWE